ncbi:Oxidase ustYa [Teratosphaeria destructans]|uniref:Oxidase ustYa n=1 Tax=Teratosphaeria destructans TaxID=418781 RepID=A0A9W7SW88_9PEZI|nr:Oxidase ustYa [Teratosphaeria destructans]
MSLCFPDCSVLPQALHWTRSVRHISSNIVSSVPSSVGVEADDNREASPLLDEVPIRYETVQFNGSFLQETIYRQRPSPEVDAAWEALGVNCTLPVSGSTANVRFDESPFDLFTVQNFIVPEKDAVRYGLDERMAKRRPRQGGGFVAQSEGIHHLHCLNLLRKSTHFNYQYYRDLGTYEFGNKDAMLEKHLSTRPNPHHSTFHADSL